MRLLHEDGRLRFPLIEPDVQISRIRLSDWFHVRAHDGGAAAHPDHAYRFAFTYSSLGKSGITTECQASIANLRTLLSFSSTQK